MDPLSITASITALLGLTSTVITYLNDVRGASEDRGRILSEIASVNSILYILQEQADQQNDTWSSTFQSLKFPEGPLAQFRMALERLASKLAPSATPLKKWGNAMAWPFQKGEIKEILSSIERQKGLLILARQNDHIKLSKAIKDGVALLRDDIGEVAKGVSRIQMSLLSPSSRKAKPHNSFTLIGKAALASEHQKIITWLKGPDPSTNYNKALEDRNPKTGLWFIESREYADWKTTRGSFLWLHGIPGCGKTILSSTILKDMFDQYSTKPNSAVLFFYFDFNDAEKQRHGKMIRSLIRQLFCYNTDSVVQNLYASCFDGNRQPTEEVLLNTFRQMIASVGDTYIVLDALDECVEQDELFRDLEQICSWEGVDLHVLVTSRREPDIEEALTPLCISRNRISIQSELVDVDIRTYIQDRLQSDPKLKKRLEDPKLQLEIKDTLMRKANGMFRWVVCQLELLRNCRSIWHTRKTLASLPRTLDDTYARILCNIDTQDIFHSREILKILQWLTFSTRPLRLEELAEIVAINVDETPRFNPERRSDEPQTVLMMCSSLITLTTTGYNPSDKENGSEPSKASQDWNVVAETSDLEGSKTYVRLAHFSVKEYLLSDRIQQGPAANYGIREIESHGVLAGDCIAYILQFDEPGSLTPEILAVSPLARYAAINWTWHARQAEKGPIEYATLLGTELLMSERGSLLNWIRIANPDNYFLEDLSCASDDLAPGIYYASLVGLLEQVKMLIDRGMEVNAEGGRYGNALQVASYEGYKDVVQVLLDNGADVNIQGGRYDNALQAALEAASDEGYPETVKILLDHGADVNAVGERHQCTALQIASEKGYGNVVKMLLDKEADVNTLDASKGSALQLASENGHESVVKLLLDEGAYVDATGEETHGTALQLASENGHGNVVKMLLDKGADVNALSMSRGTALQRASGNGDEIVVKMLLDQGADANVISGELELEGTALQIASRYGHRTVVKMLLDKGADINAWGEGSYGSALQLASYRGHENVVKMLLDEGADVNGPSGSEGSALQAASKAGYENMIKMLLDRGADVNAGPEESYDSALELASSRGYENVVKMLLDNGADVNDRSRGSALQRALLGGHENVVKLLFDNGAEVNAWNDTSGGNALQLASMSGNENVVKLLLEKGADVNARSGGSWGSALQLASEYGRENVVKLLLNKGADIDARSRRSPDSALQIASLRGRENVVKVLLDNGADVSAVGCPAKRSPIQLAIRRGHGNVVRMLLAHGAVMPEGEIESSESEYEDDASEEAVEELDSGPAPAVAS